TIDFYWLSRETKRRQCFPLCQFWLAGELPYVPRPLRRSEPMAHDLYPLPPPDLTRVLEQHLATAFPPGVALDLVLNELVVRAADATGASTAALALLRGDEMVWRAATGPHAPGLGTP